MRNAMRSVATRAMVGGMVWVGLLLISAPIHAQGVSEKSLPGNTFFYLKVDNAAKLSKEFSASQIGKMIADPAMGPLKGDLKAKLEEPSKKVKEVLGVSLKELLTLPQGTISVAMLTRAPAEAKGGPAAILLATADAGDNAEKMDAIMTKATKQGEEKGAKVATETFKDMKLTIIRHNEDDKEPLVWTKSGSTFHIATSVEALKDFLGNSSGRAQSLASNEIFQGVMKGVGEDSQVVLFADLTQILKLAIASNPGGNVAQMEDQLKMTGINSVKGFGGSFNFNKGEYDQVTKLFIYSPGPAQGLLKIFAMPPIDLKPPTWVPASVLSYQAFSWDLDAAWKGITDLVEQQGFGGFIDQAQRGIDPNGGFDFKKDLFGPLGNRITVLSDLKKPVTEKSQRALFALALDDEKKFQGTFNKLIALVNASPKKRDFQGTTIYDFEIPNIPGAAGAQMNIEGPISLAITKGNLFVATEPTFLEQILRGGTPPLADSPEFQAVAKKLPAKNSILSFDRTEDQAKLIYDMVKNGGLQKALDQANAAGQGEKVNIPVDPAKIPEFSVFAKYLGQGGSFGIMDESGVTITSFSLRKAAP